MSTATLDWSVCGSDDEWQQDLKLPEPTDPKKGVMLDITNVPVKIALMFREIEGKKVLPITCTCPRVGSLKDSSTISTPVQPTSKEVESADSGTENEQKIADTSKAYEAFDFDDESDPRGIASAKRKTPASGVKRVKKEKASLSNVVNDIRRQKLLDDMEAANGSVSGVNKPETVTESAKNVPTTTTTISESPTTKPSS